MKNTITNLLGLVFWGIAVKDALSQEPKISFIVSLLIIGIVLFLFQVKITIDFVKRLLNKGIGGFSLSNTIDPDRENPDIRG